MHLLICYAKEPRLGNIKSRLTPPLSEIKACEIYTECLKTLSARLQEIAIDKIVIASPEGEKAAILTEIFPPSRFLHWKQKGFDLGERMTTTFHEAFEAQFTHVVMIGSDSPTYPSLGIGHAFQKLEKFDAVVGPSNDGGFWLVGLRKFSPTIFNNIPLSSKYTCKCLLRGLREEGFSITKVEESYDIDTFEEVKRLRRELENPDFDEPYWSGLKRVISTL